MAKMKKNTPERFTALSNKIVRDDRLSWKARGIFLYLFSQSENWEFYEVEVAKHSSDGRDSLRSGLKELEKYGYIKRERTRNDKGQLMNSDWLLSDVPMLSEPISDKPMSEYPTQENTTLSNTNLSNTKLSNTKLSNSNKLKDKGNMSGSKEQDNIPYKEIVDYLNEKTGKNFKVGTDATRRVIKARFAEKNTLADFKKVIDVKSAEWRNDVKMQRYLQPSTLFGTKFEGYLNQSVGIKNNSQDIRNMSSEDISKLSEREIAEKWMGKDWVR